MSEGELSLLTTVDPRLCGCVLARPHWEQVPDSTTEEKLGRGEVPDGCVPVLVRTSIRLSAGQYICVI